jgi:hypothetical protein
MQEMTFPGFKFQNPHSFIHAWYIGHTRGFQPLLSPSNILSHRKVPFQKTPPPPPTGKSLKKALQTDANTHTLFCSILMQLCRDYRLVHIVGMLAFDVTRHTELFEF